MSATIIRCPVCGTLDMFQVGSANNDLLFRCVAGHAFRPRDANMPKPPYIYDALITRIVDGDTLEVWVDVGLRIGKQETVRLYGVNCPEIHSKDPVEKERGEAAKAFVKSIMSAGTQVLIQSFKPDNPDEKFGRWLAKIMLADGTDLSQRLIEAKHAVPYFGGKR